MIKYPVMTQRAYNSGKYEPSPWKNSIGIWTLDDTQQDLYSLTKPVEGVHIGTLMLKWYSDLRGDIKI